MHSTLSRFATSSSAILLPPSPCPPPSPPPRCTAKLHAWPQQQTAAVIITVHFCRPPSYSGRPPLLSNFAPFSPAPVPTSAPVMRKPLVAPLYRLDLCPSQDFFGKSPHISVMSQPSCLTLIDMSHARCPLLTAGVKHWCPSQQTGEITLMLSATAF